MLLRAVSELPDKIQSVLSRADDTGKFLCAIKTALKPNATIPILWIVLTEHKFLMCNTHRTRGLTAEYSWVDINCVRKQDKHQTSIEVIYNSMEIEDSIIPFPSTESEEVIDSLIKVCDSQIKEIA